MTTLSDSQLRDLAVQLAAFLQSQPRPTPPPTLPPPKPTLPPIKRSKKGPPLPASCKVWGDVYAPAAPVPGGVSRRNVRATYHYYSPGYETATLACADRFWADPDHGRKLLKYPWTAYCLDGRKFSQATCGKCLRVTNRRTGASIIVRAVDNGGCSDTDGTGLDLDPCAFNAIDTDKQGYLDGFMRLDVQEVDCGHGGTTAGS